MPAGLGARSGSYSSALRRSTTVRTPCAQAAAHPASLKRLGCSMRTIAPGLIWPSPPRSRTLTQPSHESSLSLSSTSFPDLSFVDTDVCTTGAPLLVLPDFLIVRHIRALCSQVWARFALRGDRHYRAPGLPWCDDQHLGARRRWGASASVWPARSGPRA